MVEQLILAIISLLIGALLSFFVTTLTHRATTKTIAKEISSIAIQEHELKCKSVQQEQINKITKAMIFLVSQNGGNPNDYNLFER